MGFVPPKPPMSRRRYNMRLNQIMCTHEFKGELCRYGGLSSACRKTIEACRLNGNEENFGGFPAMSFNGISEFRPSVSPSEPVRVSPYRIYTEQIPNREVEIQTQFPLNLRDIFHINDREYVCVRVRYNEGHQYRITLRAREEVIDVDMRKALEHTRMRFDTMTERKLWNRMGATTDMNKLIAFAQVADERGMSAIAAAARARFEELYHRGYPIDRLSYTTEDNNKPVKKINERLLRKIDI